MFKYLAKSRFNTIDTVGIGVASIAINHNQYFEACIVAVVFVTISILTDYLTTNEK